MPLFFNPWAATFESSSAVSPSLSVISPARPRNGSDAFAPTTSLGPCTARPALGSHSSHLPFQSDQSPPSILGAQQHRGGLTPSFLSAHLNTERCAKVSMFRGDSGDLTLGTSPWRCADPADPAHPDPFGSSVPTMPNQRGRASTVSPEQRTWPLGRAYLA